MKILSCIFLIFLAKNINAWEVEYCFKGVEGYPLGASVSQDKGRTWASAMFRKSEDVTEIHYVDITNEQNPVPIAAVQTINGNCIPNVKSDVQIANQNWTAIASFTPGYLTLNLVGGCAVMNSAANFKVEYKTVPTWLSIVVEEIQGVQYAFIHGGKDIGIAIFRIKSAWQIEPLTIIKPSQGDNGLNFAQINGNSILISGSYYGSSEGISMIDVNKPDQPIEIYSNQALTHRSMTVSNIDGTNYLFLLDTLTQLAPTPACYKTVCGFEILENGINTNTEDIKVLETELYVQGDIPLSIQQDDGKAYLFTGDVNAPPNFWADITNLDNAIQLDKSELPSGDSFTWSRDSSYVTTEGIMLVGAGDNCVRVWKMTL